MIFKSFFKSFFRHLPNLSAAVCAALLLSGCGDAAKSAGTATGPSTPQGQKIYVVQLNKGVLQFSTSQSGDVTPVTTLISSGNLNPAAVAVDGSGNIYDTQVLVTSVPGGLQSQTSVLSVFSADSTGAATANRTISGLSGTSRMTVDQSGQIYTYSSPAVLVYSSNANGDVNLGEVQPARIILGSNGQTCCGQSVDALTTDNSLNLYVATHDALGKGSILVFPPTANGNTAPTRTITGTLTQLGTGTRLAMNSTGNLCAKTSSPDGTVRIIEFASGIDGNVSPTRTITGTTSHPLTTVGGIAFDSANNLYVVSNPYSSNFTIDKYTAGTSDSVDPASQIHSSTSLTNPGESIAIF